MNPAEKRKQIGQVVVLVVLLAVLGISMTVMLRTVSRSRSGAPPAVPPATPTATAPAEDGAAPEATAADGGDSTRVASGIPAEFNPNLFRIYSLNPPKNPFMQEERWYTEELAESLPGYPEIRDSAFLEDLNPSIPGMENLLEDGESWRQISMEKVEEDTEYTLTGESSDGRIQTRITYTGEPGQRVKVDWDRRSGVPVSALADMDWQESVPDTLPDDLGEGADLFDMPGGLTVPGGTNGLFSEGSSGQILICQGVSGEGREASALILYNDTPRIVQAGDSLPPRYIIEAITEDGVILRDVKDGETSWLPIGGKANSRGGSVGVRAPAGGGV